MPWEGLMQLTPHFKLEEFTLSSTALAHGIDNTPTEEHMPNIQMLAEHMEEVRALFNRVIEITSGYRNPQVNDLVGGVPTSDHARGFAADFHVSGIADIEAAKVIRDSTIDFYQLIYEENRCVHLSFNPKDDDNRGRRQVLRQPCGPVSTSHME